MKHFSNYSFRISVVLLMAFIFNVGKSNLSAQVKLEVAPQQTDELITTIQGPHLVLYNPDIPLINKLVLMIPGTGGSPKGYLDFENYARDNGYHVIGLDYKNTVITTICTKSSDPKCFDNFRKEIVLGTPVSDKVEVDSANSLVNRFQKLLLYLVKSDPNGGWDKYINGDKIQWKNIIVAGHSQGAGHAGFLGQQYKTARVLMFSGPQDYFEGFNSPAGWLSEKPKTRTSKFYAFLHEKDPFNMSWQLANSMKLRQTSRPDTLIVKPGIPVPDNKHILIATNETKNPHGVTLQPDFKNVWEYMLPGGKQKATID